MTETARIEIDGLEIEVDRDMTILQACEAAGIEIPRFCYHERLSIAGNCRMCLVEVLGGPPKPTASCAMQVRDLRPGPDGEPPRVSTKSPMVRKAREGVMEFLLINHPLDCPICDQGGECDLQDQAMAYGVDFSRFREAKRAVDDLDLGPLVETHMTRCISCTRCVRFTTEVAGLSQMGQTGRGEDAEITSYLGETLKSNLQGNIIDLCPVGALTSKPYAFTARPWELRKTETIDVMDALGSSIRVDAKGREIMRIIPRNHDGVNEEWISDKTRFVWDGLSRQRLDQPYVRQRGRLRPAGWDEALDLAARKIQEGRLAAIAGDLAPAEAVFALGKLARALGGATECRTDGAMLPEGNRSGYAGTARIEDIDSARRILVIGADPASEAPVLNARIRKAWLSGAEVELVGPWVDMTFACSHLGDGGAALEKALRRLDPKSGPAVVIVGQGAIRRKEGGSVIAAAQRAAARSGGGVLILHAAASRVGAMDAGFTHPGGIAGALRGAEVIYNLGADELEIKEGPFVIYQGSHGDRGAHRADLILPAAAYTEESGIFVNMEGRPQMAFQATFPPGEARENWAVIRAVSGKAGHAPPWNTLAQLREALLAEIPHMGGIDEVPENPLEQVKPGPLPKGSLGSPAADFYLSNPIARASPLMAELSRAQMSRSQGIAAE